MALGKTWFAFDQSLNVMLNGVMWLVVVIFGLVRRKKKQQEKEDEERLRRENSDDTINQPPSRNRTFTGIGNTPTPRNFQRDMDSFLAY